MTLDKIYKKALDKDFLSEEEALMLYREAPLHDLMSLAHQLRNENAPGELVTWQIDRNVNITNVCSSQCKFCNFYVRPGAENAYITSPDEYKEKIKQLIELGGDQLLLQGGLHPKLGLSFYKELFSSIKGMYPTIKLHALGPPEIVFLSKKEKMSYREVLEELVQSGLDSLPGAGAEILCDRVREIISPAKAKTIEWLQVMEEAHKLDLITSATMMFGHVETIEERVEHILLIRDLQDRKPEGHTGFLAFIPWPYQDEHTVLKEKMNVINHVRTIDYIRMIAISRILLPNIINIQASWLTVGIEVAQICLYAGANDLGSIMIEENVVSSAGAQHRMDARGIQEAIRAAGFKPQFRNQKYEYLAYQSEKKD